MNSWLWHGTAGAGVPFTTLFPEPRPWPDFPSLIRILQDVGQTLDTETGETTLTSQEAAKICACGWQARAGLWRCPLLPDDLVWSVPVLRTLSDLYGPETRGDRWHPKRARVLPKVAPVECLGKFDKKLILGLQKAPGQRRDRRTLIRTYWRRGARFVRHRIAELLKLDFITEQDGFFYPISEAAFKTWREELSRPSRPVPVSTFY